MDDQVRVAKKGDVLVPVPHSDQGNYLISKEGGEEVRLLASTEVEVMVPSRRLRRKLCLKRKARVVDAYFDFLPQCEDDELLAVFCSFHTEEPLFSLDALESGVEILVIETPDGEEIPETKMEDSLPATKEPAMAVAAAAGGGMPPWFKS